MNIAELPTTEVWGEYDWQAVLAGFDVVSYVETTATEIITQADKGPVTVNRVKAVKHMWTASEEGYSQVEVYAVVELVDGWAALEAGCDTTGWDCQSGGQWKWAATYDDVIRNGLDESGRDRLGLTLK